MSASQNPASDFKYRHSLPVQIRFNDVDIFGHLNNSVYLQFCDLGKLRYFEAVLGTDFQNSGLAVVVANINCDFFSPAFMDEDLQVFTVCEHIGCKSMKLRQRVVAVASGDVKCEVRTVMVGFSPKTLTSAEIPADVRAAFEAFEGRKFSIEA